MSTLEDTGVIIDVPNVDVDSLTTFIRDRILQRPAVQIEHPTQEMVALTVEAPVIPSGSAGPEPRSPLARSLLSLGSYIEILHADLSAMREWQRLEVEQDAGREYRLTEALERIAGAVAAVAADVARINSRLTQLEQVMQDVATDARQVRVERTETGVGRIWSRVRGTGS